MRELPPTPESIGPFQVIRPIAAGGMAEVYEVEDPVTGERYALKLLVQVEPALRRFDREYEAMTRLNHPGIVRVLHYGNHQGHPWMTMELVRGTPAQNHVKRYGPPSHPGRIEEVIRIGWHLALALGYIHDRGLIHRDIKSANVLVLPDERVKVIDFGTAYVVDALERITLDDEFVGTFGYAAPEQIRGDPVDRRTDLYAMGVLLYRLLSGKRPFDDDDPKRLAYKVLHHEAKPISELVLGASAELVGVVDRLLAKNPEDRPQSAASVVRALERAANTRLTMRSRIAVHVPEGVSRATERAAIWRALEAEGPGALVWVEGADACEASRLGAALVADAADRGRQAWGVTFEGHDGMATLLDLASVVANSLSEANEDGLTERLRAATAPEVLVADPERAQLAEAIADVITEAVASNKVAIVLCGIERAGLDAHRVLARLSAALASRGAECGLIVLLERTAAELTELRNLETGSSIPLRVLSPRDVAVAVGTMLGRKAPTARIARALHAATGGRPTLVEAAVEELVSRGAVEAEGDFVAWADATVDVPIPARSIELDMPLLDRLSMPERRLLECLTRLREPASLSVVAAALGWPENATEIVVDNAVRRGSVVRTGVAFELKHASLGQLIRGSITARRHAAYNAASTAMSQAAVPGSGIVRWFAEAARPTEALTAAVAVAEHALHRSAWRGAAEALELALPGVPTDDPRRGHAWTLLAGSLAAVNPSAPASARALVRARDTVSTDDPPLRAQLDLAWAQLHAGIGHFKNHRKLVKEAWTRVDGLDGNHELRARIAMENGRGHQRLGEVGNAEQWYRRARTEGTAINDATAVGRADIALAAIDVSRARLDEAAEVARAVLSVAENLDDDALTLTALTVWADAMRRAARFSEAFKAIANHLPRASQSEHVVAYVRLLLVSAKCEIDLGRLGRAQNCMDEVSAALEKGQHLDVRLESELVAGSILVASGQDRDAVWRLDQVQQKARAAELVVLADVARSQQAEALWNLGDREAARDLFQSAVLGLLSTGDLAALADACAASVRVGGSDADPTVVFRPIQKLIDQHPPPMVLLEYRLAVCERAAARNDARSARVAAQDALRLLQKIAERLDETDRAALRVHPIARRLRLALR